MKVNTGCMLSGAASAAPLILHSFCREDGVWLQMSAVDKIYKNMTTEIEITMA